MNSLQVESPAKLNLALRVIGKPRDGYHRLYTLFHRISLEDTLRLQKRREGIRLFSSDPRLPKKKNLIVRAFHLLQSKHPFPGGVAVRLTKRIPVGSGLGGGSSNAAHFLIGMNRLFRLNLTLKELARLGSELGADVPFFLFQRRQAIGKERGDQIQPLSFRRRLWFLLLCDRKGLSTRKVYQGLRLPKKRVSLTQVTHDVRMASVLLERGDLSRAARFLKNDLAESAEQIRPSIIETRESLRGLQPGPCYMSGSGPTLFLIFLSRAEAFQAVAKLRRQRFSHSFVVCHSL